MLKWTSTVSHVWAAVAVAVIGIAALAPALAQQAQTAGPVSLGDLFVVDTGVLKPGAADKLGEAAARAVDERADCPKEARFKVVVKEGDAMFQHALGTARRDTLKAVLGALPVRFVVDDNVEIGGRVDDVRVDYQAIPDREKPKLDTNSIPPKGTKVKPGDKIEVTMVARDDANRWQSGIQSIQLLAESDGNRSVRVQGWQPQPRTCEQAPEPRRLVATYEVPRNPPPVVRLRAIAEDFVNHHDTDLGEFPTGDWYGTIDWRIPFPNGRLWGRLDLTFDYDGQGNLKGRMTGDDHVEAQTPCGPTTTQTPSKLSANLVGQYTPGRNTMSLRVADQKFEQGQFSMCAIAPGGGYQRLSGQRFGGGGPLGQPGLAQLLNSLTVRADGSVEASGEWPVTPAEAKSTLHLKLTLRKAQN